MPEPKNGGDDAESRITALETAIFGTHYIGPVVSIGPENLRISEVSKITEDLGYMREGTIELGQRAQRRVTFSDLDVFAGLIAFDDYGRPYFRVSYTYDYFRLGLPGNPSIEYENNAVAIHGGCITPGTLDFAALTGIGAFTLGDATVYETNEVSSLGLDMMSVIIGAPTSAEEIVDERSGITYRPVSYLDEEYVQNDANLTHIGFDFLGPVVWRYTQPAWYVGHLDDQQIWAWYGGEGLRIQPRPGQGGGSFQIGVVGVHDELEGFMDFGSSVDDSSFRFYYTPDGGMAMKHGWPLSAKDALRVNKNGVEVGNYLAMTDDSVEPSAPPVSALVYDRENDYWKFWTGTVYRRISDEAV